MAWQMEMVIYKQDFCKIKLIGSLFFISSFGMCTIGLKEGLNVPHFLNVPLRRMDIKTKHKKTVN